MIGENVCLDRWTMFAILHARAIELLEPSYPTAFTFLTSWVAVVSLFAHICLDKMSSGSLKRYPLPGRRDASMHLTFTYHSLMFPYDNSLLKYSCTIHRLQNAESTTLSLISPTLRTVCNCTHTNANYYAITF